MFDKEKLLGRIFLGATSLLILSGAYSVALLLEVKGEVFGVGWGALSLVCLLGSYISAVLWCKCRHTLARRELEDLPSVTKEGANPSDKQDND